MKPKLIGVYEAGIEWIELYGREGSGANFVLNPKEKLPRIEVGLDHKYLRDIVVGLHHEIWELLMDRLGCRYCRGTYIGNDSGEYLFSMDHIQFSEICARAAEFIDYSLNPLKKAWKEYKASK